MSDPLTALRDRRARLAADAGLLAARMEEIDGLIRVLEGCGAAVPVPRPATAYVFADPPGPPAAVAPPAPPPAAPLPSARGVEGPAGPKPHARGPAGEWAARLAKILAHGPLTPKQLGETLGESAHTIGYHLRGNPDLFAKTDPENYKSPYTLTAAGRDAATAGGT